MKIKYMLLLLVALAGFTAAQEYPLVTLNDINYVPDSTWASFPPSPLAGDTVKVQGMIMVRPIVNFSGDRRPVIWAGARWMSYIEDPAGNIWGGLNILTNDTSANAQQTGFDLADTGKVYEFTGVVTPYFQSTELILLTNPTPVPINLISNPGKRVAPIRLTMDSLMKDGNYNFAMRKYQGMYVELVADASHNLITSDRVTGTGSASGNFRINDGDGDYAVIYAQSTYFKSNANGIRPGYQPPADGSYLAYVRGILTLRADAYYIVPCYPNDLGEVLLSPPVVSTIKRSPAIVGPNQAVTVTAKVNGVSAPVTTVKLFYQVNNGGYDSLIMTRPVPADTSNFSVVIPGVPDSAFVNFYIKATDSNNLSVTNPQKVPTGNYHYLVLNRPLTIRDIRYSPLGGGFSGYNNYRVEVTGTVTADTSDIKGHATNPARVYIQNGDASWSGIILGTSGVNGTQVAKLKRGWNVTVSGVVMLSSSTGTRLDSLTFISIDSTQHTLPDFKLLTTVEVGTNTLGKVSAEQWASMLVKYQTLTIDTLNADNTTNFGESYVNDGTRPHTRVIWSDGNTTYHNGYDSTMINLPGYTFVQKGDHFSEIRGVLGFTHSQYKLTPRKNDDVIGYVSGLNEVSDIVPDQYKLNQNYPNPFNPSTVITYSIPKSGMVTLKIYNILGQEVRTLVNQMQNPGSYSFTFEATRLSSGIYFYSLTTDNFTQVKKMMFIK